jgi:hypothetical protein
MGPEPAFGISAKVARGCSWTGRIGNTRSIGSQYVGKGGLRAFLKKKPLQKKAGDLLNPSRNQLRITTGLLQGQSFKRT